MKRDYAVYHVALKVLLRKGNELLFLKDPEGKYWDLPGGRIDNVESKVPLERILAREVREELGRSVKYTLGKPAFQFRKYFEPRKIYILQTVYEADYVSGEIKISDEHSSYHWINTKDYTFKEKEFFSKEEFKAFRKYFGDK